MDTLGPTNLMKLRKLSFSEVKIVLKGPRNCPLQGE